MRYFCVTFTTNCQFTLKNTLIIFLLFAIPLGINAQSFYLKAEGRTEFETKVIDSIPYNKVHENAKSVADEAGQISELLFKRGYLENKLLSHIKANDSLFIYTFSIGSKTEIINISTKNLTVQEKELLSITDDTLKLPVTEVENFMKNNIGLLEKKGYSLSSLQLSHYSKSGNTLNASLNISVEKKRKLDGLIIEGYDKFPEGIKRSIVKKYRKRVFNKDNLQRVYSDFNALPFVSQIKYPEILFKEDSTKVYVYLEKAKPNVFDGFIGFSNDDDSGSVRFNGYLELLLVNILNSGERFNLYWKNNGEEQTTFDTSLELPYIFKSPIGIKGSLNIFKQDSTFQTTVTDLNVGYYFNYNSKLYLGYRQTESTDIQNLNNSTISDYTNTFWTSTYEFTGYAFNDFLFPEKTTIIIKGGLGSRDTNTNSLEQYFIQADISHNIYLNKENIINIKNETYYLESDSYIINELHRFGGINSFRGFNENSLQASLYSALLAEYRYKLTPSMYVHSITDYGYFQDKTSDVEENILGLGFGFGLLTKNGLFNLVYANGSTKNQPIKLSNSIVHLSFKAKF